jgi:VanZ family protein
MLKPRLGSKYFIVPISLSLILIIISLLPLPKLPEVRFIASDKLAHLLVFLLLMLSYLWAFKKSKQAFTFTKAMLFSFIICSVIGGGIELLQHYLPVNRTGDWFDFYFDIAGMIVGSIFFKMLDQKRLLILFIGILMPAFLLAQDIQSSKEFQEELNSEFYNPLESPLDSADLLHFTGLEFFPVNEAYIVKGTLERQQSPAFFEMETTTARRPEYRVWAKVYFILNDEECQLTIYQNKKLMNTLEYSDYLFLPFTDLTNGESTYYGGRYVDLRIVEGDTIIIDFNKAYNPSCAYSSKYSCPKVPAENQLNLAVQAGVKKFH